jgi:Uncharacterised protein family (UPF0164)
MNRINLMKKVQIFTALLAMASLSAQQGQTAYQFLNIPASARQTALGGNIVALRDKDPNMAEANPALNNLLSTDQLSANFSLHLGDAKFGTLAYTKDLKHGHLINVHARYLDYGQLDRTDEFGNTTGKFSAYDAAVGLGYTYQFEENWSIGVNGKFVSSGIDTYKSMAAAMDLGFSSYNPEESFCMGLVFKNIGRQIKTFNGTVENMPFHIDFGVSQKLEKFPATISIGIHDLQRFNISQNLNKKGEEIGFLTKAVQHLNIGAEFFPDKPFNLRIGYNVRRGTELTVLDQTSFAGLSAGFGFKTEGFSIDYAYARMHNAANINQLGLTFEL